MVNIKISFLLMPQFSWFHRVAMVNTEISFLLMPLLSEFHRVAMVNTQLRFLLSLNGSCLSFLGATG